MKPTLWQSIKDRLFNAQETFVRYLKQDSTQYGLIFFSSGLFLAINIRTIDARGFIEVLSFVAMALGTLKIVKDRP